MISRMILGNHDLGYIYTTGGRWIEPTSSGERYNNEVNRWFAIKYMKYERERHALVSLGGKRVELW